MEESPTSNAAPRKLINPWHLVLIILSNIAVVLFIIYYRTGGAYFTPQLLSMSVVILFSALGYILWPILGKAARPMRPKLITRYCVFPPLLILGLIIPDDRGHIALKLILLSAAALAFMAGTSFSIIHLARARKNH